MTGESLKAPGNGEISGQQGDGRSTESEKGEYIATFYSHYGALSFKKQCDRAGFPARIMPVPRALSSSCGTCVRFAGDFRTALAWKTDELEQIAAASFGDAYKILWESLSSV